MKRCHKCVAVISSGHEVYVQSLPYHTNCAPERTAEIGVRNIMSMKNKLSEALAKGIELERDRCMGLCIELIQGLQKGLNKKLMTSQEKHIADLKLTIGKGVVGAIQMKIMTGAQPNAEATSSEVHGQDTDALGGTQGDPDGGRSA